MQVSFGRGTAWLVASVAWTALLAQYVLLVDATWTDIGPWRATLRYFSFFTILGNLAVALAAMSALSDAPIACLRLFRSPRARACAALCIAIVCVIYHVLLAGTWSPQGLQYVVDVLLHYAVPFLYLGWWLLANPHGALAWGDPLRWLAFPAAFLAWALLRGAWVHEYPYPFIDVDALGGARVLRNAAAIAGLFAGLGFVVVALDRALARRAAAAEGVRRCNRMS